VRKRAHEPFLAEVSSLDLDVEAAAMSRERALPAEWLAPGTFFPYDSSAYGLWRPPMPGILSRLARAPGAKF